MQGRLLGKRLHAEFFVDEMDAGHGVEGCNYLLALEMEMDPVPGYALASWEQGYGDFDVRPDMATLRRIPWLEATALVLGDVQWHDGKPVQPSPRQVLKAQLDRAAALGFTPMMGSELEFYLLRETFEEAHEKDYSGLTPSVPYILDYHILATTYDEAFLRQIRNGMQAAGHARRDVQGRGVAWPAGDQLPLRRRADDGGQPCRSTRTAPRRSRSSTVARSPSWRSRSRTGSATPAISTRRCGATARRALRLTRPLFSRWLAGQIACFKELAIFLAPTINSYKRFAAGSWAPTTLAWGNDNRTCGFRVVGHGPARRAETRIPGGDANPYLAFAAVIAAGLHGIEHELELPPGLEGNAYESDAERFPSTMREAVAALEGGSMARDAFGDQVVDHYLNYARTEQTLYDSFVTDWERKRYYERG